LLFKKVNRTAVSEYKSQSSDDDKNKLLDEIRFVDDDDGKIFNIAPDGGGQFKLDLTSHFYRVNADHSAGPSLAVRFIGNAGFSVPADEYLKIGTDETYYQYTGSPTTSTDNGSTIYTFTIPSGIPATADYTTIRQVIQTTIGSDVNDSGTLTLGSGQGALFPSENGMFLITKQTIKANLPVKTIVPYRYEYRNGDQLVNVQKGPDQSSFTTIDSGSTLVEIAKLLSVDSTGFAPEKASALASATNNYRLSLDITASSPGLKSYWSFDDSGAPGKDDYGTSDATLEGGVSTGTGKVGGGLEFDATKTGYVKTTFNPALAIGSDQEFSVVFWVKPGADITTPQGILGVYDSAGSNDFFIGIINDHFAWGLGSHREVCSDTVCAAEDLPAATAEEWQHVAFVYDGSDVILSINGVEKYRQEHSGTATMPNYNIYLGAVYDPDTGSNIYGFTGSLDEVAVFNTDLTFCEVSAIFNVPTTIPCNVACDEEGALAYYPFNGNADDENGTDRNGTFDGTVFGATLTEDQCGLTDMAYSFDGNDYIATTFNPNTEIGNNASFTVAFWAKPDRKDKFMSVVGVYYDPDPEDPSQIERFYIAIYDATEGWLWGYGDTPGPVDGSLPDAVAGEWVHIGWVYDQGANEVIIYVNGDEIIQSDPYTGNGVLPNTNTDIGARLEGLGHPTLFEGTIDEVLIWDRALTPAEMLDLYKGTNP